MSGKIEYVWPALTLEHDTATGWTNTRYPDGHTSGCAPVPDDALHAEALGIAPERHRLVHELLHHLVGFTFGYVGSPVVWRDAHDLEQDTAVLCVAGHMSSARIFPGCAQPYLTAEIEEWIVTAYTYALYGKPHDAGAMMDVQRLCGVHSDGSIRALAWLALGEADRTYGAPKDYQLRMPPLGWQPSAKI